MSRNLNVLVSQRLRCNACSAGYKNSCSFCCYLEHQCTGRNHTQTYIFTNCNPETQISPKYMFLHTLILYAVFTSCFLFTFLAHFFCLPSPCTCIQVEHYLEIKFRLRPTLCTGRCSQSYVAA